MKITVDDLSGNPRVGAVGWLDPGGAADLSTALLKAAADNPEAVICDLGGLVSDAAGLTVLLSVADKIARWPSCPIIVVAPAERLRLALAGLGVDRRLPVVESLALVPSALARPAVPRATLLLAPELTAPARARRFVQEFVRTSITDEAGEGPDEVLVALVVDELVTNAVVHARTPIQVLLSLRAATLRVAVADRSERAPAPRAPHQDDENGRGLALVTALSHRWGVSARRSGGKVVWAVLDGTRIPRPARSVEDPRRITP
jgi:anti-sigma regulatory factor (Ser/Thr protein kinase)